MFTLSTVFDPNSSLYLLWLWHQWISLLLDHSTMWNSHAQTHTHSLTPAYMHTNSLTVSAGTFRRAYTILLFMPCQFIHEHNQIHLLLLLSHCLSPPPPQPPYLPLLHPHCHSLSALTTNISNLYSSGVYWHSLLWRIRSLTLMCGQTTARQAPSSALRLEEWKKK